MHRKVWLFVLLFVLGVAACREGGDTVETPGPGTARATTAAGAPQETAQPQEAGQVAPRRAPKDAAQSQAQATATPQPLPTADPQLPEWTIFVYMDAGEGLAQAALRDLNGLEAAGESVRVNVLAQAQLAADEGAAGWNGARRYELRYDEDPEDLNSLLQSELGQVDMADPAVLAGFVAWGVENYPANHYALLIWDHGGQGPGAAALGEAVQQGLAQAGRPRLDIVGLDAGRMSRLEVYGALQGHADFAVASAQPAPEPGWRYESLLRDLFTEPLVAPAELAQTMAQHFVQYHSGERGNEFASMVAVDLQQFAAVTASFSSLAQALEDASPPALADVAAARAAAGDEFIPGAPAPDGSQIDLQRFAAALGEQSADGAVVEASQALLAALEGAVLAQARGAALPPAGDITFYFPPRPGAYEDAQAALAAPAWSAFLSAYFETARENGAPPVISAAPRGEEAASAQRPAYVDLELGGWNIGEVTAAAVRREEEDRLRLVAYEALAPNPDAPGADPPPRWPDGVRHDYYVWDTTAAYVSDGANGDFAVLWPAAGAGNLVAVEGQYVPAGEGEGREASLVFEAQSGQLHGIWEQGAGGPQRQIEPRTGAGFQLYNYYLGDEAGADERRSVSYEPGVTLVFSDGAEFSYDSYPLPGGDYLLQFAAGSAGGHVGAAQADVAVDNEALTPGLQAYLDPYHGFQFLYPLTWPVPAYEEGQLVTQDAESGRRFSVALLPGVTGESELKNVALERFGAVDVLYETQATAGGQTALLTAYGYEAQGESRTGLLATFAHNERDLGFVVDLDGPAEGEAETIALMDGILAGWQFRPVGLGAAPGQWTRREVGGLDVAVPAAYAYERLENGWERFSSGDVFVALRTEAASGAGRPQIVDRWLEVAGNGVEAFEAGAPQPFALAGTGWSRADFSYEGSAGNIRGFIMATIVDGREVVAWVEAPAAEFESLQAQIFLVMLADALAGAGESGLLYKEAFDQVGDWGAGGVEGAEAAVEDGAYRLAVSAEQGFFWATAGQSFADGTFEVEAVQTAGPLDNGFGFLLRADAEQASFYALAISGDGYVWIGQCEEGCARPTTLVGEGWFFSEAVRQGLDARNRLRVEALGQSLRFFVNGEEVGRIEDAETAPGDVGLFVETLGEGGVVVAFDELRVVAP